MIVTINATTSIVEMDSCRDFFNNIDRGNNEAVILTGALLMAHAYERDISASLRKTLHTKSLHQLYLENWSKEERDKHRASLSVSGANPDKFKPFPSDPSSYFRYDKDMSQPYTVSIPCKLIESCPDYNRTNFINYEDCVKNLKKYGNKFICEADEASGNPIVVWYDSKRDKFRVVRGNHRTIMKLLTDGDDATIEAYVKVHNPTHSDDDIFNAEATTFDVDNEQTGQNKQSRFKGQLLNAISNPSADRWPIELYEYLDNLETPIGIADTNKDALVTLDGFTQISNTMKEIKDDTNLSDPYEPLSEVLNGLVRYAIPENREGKKCGTVNATLVEHMRLFKKYFKREINAVSKDNNINAFDKFLEYIFKERHKENSLFDKLNQQELVKNSTKIREMSYYVASLCTLFNEFVKANDLKKGHEMKDTHGTQIIKDSGASWTGMIANVKNADFHVAIRSRLGKIYYPSN